MNFIDVWVKSNTVNTTDTNGMLANSIDVIDERYVRIQDSNLVSWTCNMTSHMSDAIESSGIFDDTDNCIVELAIDDTWASDMLAAIAVKRGNGDVVAVDWTGAVYRDCPMISWNPSTGHTTRK